MENTQVLPEAFMKASFGDKQFDDLNVELTPASSEPVDEAVFNFEWTGQIAGFSVEGQFSYDENQSYTEGIVREEDLLSFDISFFDPDGNLLRTYEDNHLTFPQFNFAYDTDTGEILQDGYFLAPDGLNVGEKTAVGEDEFTGLNFWSRPEFNSQGEVPPPHLHIDDWSNEFGFPPGFSSHEDVAFFTRTTQELIDTGRVGETYIDQLQDSLDEIGQRIEVTPVEDTKPTFEPVFGSLDGDIIEVEGSNQLVFAGADNDLVDASIASEGGNRIYLGSGDDTGILGQGDRYSGETGDDQFFTTTGGGNVITGGKDADQFWIAVAEIPTAVFEIPASDSYYTYAGNVSRNSDRRLLADKANVIGFPDRQTISFLQFDLTDADGISSDAIGDVIGAEVKLEHDSDLAPTLISATDERPLSLSTYRLTAPYDPVNGNVDDIDYGVNGANAISTTVVGDDGIYNWDLTELVDELTNSSASKVELALSGVFGNVNTDGRNSYASFYPANATDGLEPTLVIETEAINVITDFTSGEDVIGIAGFGIGFEDVDLTQLGDDALVGTNGINFALLEDVDINDLSASDFAFG